MKNIKYIVYCFILGNMLLACAGYSIIKKNEQDFDQWIGRYIYTETYPHYDSGPNYFTCHMITIFKHNKECYAIIQGDGWQLTSRTFACVTGDDHEIEIRFSQTLPGDLVYEHRRYDQNELLLRLECDELGILTEWGGLRMEHPIFSDRDDEINGIYFEKIKQEKDNKNPQIEGIIVIDVPFIKQKYI